MSSYRWDTRCADLELARLERGFTGNDIAALGGVLLAAFVETQTEIHVETGRLKASGEAKLLHSGSHAWSGEISYGGNFSYGGKRAGRYAASEYFGTSPRYGGPPNHNWMRHAEGDVGGDMEAVVDAYFNRGHLTPHPEGLR